MNTRKYALPIILFLALFLIAIFMMQFLQASLHGTTMILGVDLYPRWVGTQAILHGESPYSQATRQQIWLEIYGSADTPDGNLFGFYYPPAITTLLMPFVLSGLSSSPAAVLWCAFLFALFSTTLLLCIIKFRTLPKGLILLPALLVSGWLFRPAFSNYILGQYALFSVLMAFITWRFFEIDKPVWAGIFAALSLIKPSLTIIPIGFLFIQNWHKPKGILSLFAALLLLYLPPTILLGWWLPDFLTDISKYALENRVAWSFADLATFPGILWLLASILLIGLGIYGKDSLLVFGAAFALNAVFGPHTADYDLVAFVPLLVYLGQYYLLTENRRGWLITLFFILIWLPWISLIIFLRGSDSNAVETWYRFIWLAYPLIILLLGLFTQFPVIRDMKKGQFGISHAN